MAPLCFVSVTLLTRVIFHRLLSSAYEEMNDPCSPDGSRFVKFILFVSRYASRLFFDMLISSVIERKGLFQQIRLCKIKPLLNDLSGGSRAVGLD